MKLKALSIYDKVEKLKAKKLAQTIVDELDLSDVFKEQEKTKKNKE
jgi:hypothetical protein